MELRIPEDGIPTRRQAVEEDRRGLVMLASVCLSARLHHQAPLSRLWGAFLSHQWTPASPPHFLHRPLHSQSRKDLGQAEDSGAGNRADSASLWRPCWGLPGKNVDRGRPTPPGLPHQPRSLTQGQTERLFSRESPQEGSLRGRRAALIGLQVPGCSLRSYNGHLA